MTQHEIDTEISQLKSKLAYFFYGAAFVLLMMFFVQKCTPEPTTVKTEEVKGKFEAVKPKNEPIINTEPLKNVPIRQKLSKNDKSKNDNVQYNAQNDSLISELLKENELLSRAYYDQNDSIKKGMFEKAIQLNKFSQTFDDQNVKIDVSGVARGTVESIKTDYTIKSKQIPIKQRVFALKTGVEYGNTTSLSNSVFKGNLEFENKKGNSYNISYDTDSRYWLGAKFTIFEIKR